MRVPIDASPHLATFNDTQPLSDALVNLVTVLVNRPFMLAEGERRQAEAQRKAEIHRMDLAARPRQVAERQSRITRNIIKTNPKNAGQEDAKFKRDLLKIRNIAGKFGAVPTVDDMKAGVFRNMAGDPVTEDDWLKNMGVEGHGATATEALRRLRQNESRSAAPALDLQAIESGLPANGEGSKRQAVPPPRQSPDAARAQGFMDLMIPPQPQQQAAQARADIFQPDPAVQSQDRDDIQEAIARMRARRARGDLPAPRAAGDDDIDVRAVSVREKARAKGLNLGPFIDAALKNNERGGPEAMRLLDELADKWGDDEAVAKILREAADVTKSQSRDLIGGAYFDPGLNQTVQTRGVRPELASQTYAIIRSAVNALMR